MNKKPSFVLLVLVFIFLLSPSIALATPLTGANTDVGKYFKYEVGDFYYEDDTTDANDADSSNTVATSGSDVNWSDNGNTKHISIGHLTSKFTKVYFNVTGTSNDGASDLGIKYWNGSSWADLTLDSQTHPFNSTGINSISFSAPSDWATTSVGGSTGYYIRLQGTGFVNATVIQVSLYIAPVVSTPEFSDFLSIIILVGAIYFIHQKIQTGKSFA